MTEAPVHLIELQRAADAERDKLPGLSGDEHSKQMHNWREAATTLHLAITSHATEQSVDRHQLEAAVKKATWHPDPETSE